MTRPTAFFLCGGAVRPSVAPRMLEDANGDRMTCARTSLLVTGVGGVEECEERGRVSSRTGTLDSNYFHRPMAHFAIGRGTCL